MKLIKKLLFVFLLLASLTLVACSSNNNEDLENRIIALENALTEAEFNVQELQEKVADYEKKYSNLSTRVDSRTDDLTKKVSLLDSELAAVKAANDKSIQVCLADEYYLVVGDTFQLFYRSVVRAQYPYGYYIKVTGDLGHTYNRYFELTPTTAGTLNLTIEVCDDNGVVLGKDSTKLIVSKNKTTSTKTVLCIGDSLTANGQWVGRGVSKFKAAGATINTVGTMNATYSNVKVYYEGRVGWSWSNYLTSMDGVTSPFKNSYGISFKDYIKNNKLATFDEVYIMMTFNGFTDSDHYDFDTAYIKAAKTLIDKIHEEYPSALITLMGLPLTSTYAGLGAYYNINQTYSDNYGVIMKIFEYDNFLENWTNMDEYKDFMRYIDIKGQFDSENNMPSESKNVNTTNSAKEPVGNAMGMHPSTNGYNQIGDAFFRALMSDWGK